MLQIEAISLRQDKTLLLFFFFSPFLFFTPFVRPFLALNHPPWRSATVGMCMVREQVVVFWSILPIENPGVGWGRHIGALPSNRSKLRGRVLRATHLVWAANERSVLPKLLELQLVLFRC
jgi:hypothetical protein